MITRKIIGVVIFLTIALNFTDGFSQSRNSIPLIWCTDLFHPHQDPDDHLDLITAFSMKEFDIKAVLLDQGGQQEVSPGSIPLTQMMNITGKDFPFAIGLSKKLNSIDDTGEDQASNFQGAVELLIKTLRESDKPVEVIVAGSLRDVAAAYNREPELLKEKISRLHINIGRAAVGKGEWNVHLDPFAYDRIINSGINIFWYPCMPLFDNNSSHFLLTSYSKIIDTAPLKIQNFFIYALSRVSPEELDPVKALNMNLRPFRKLIWGREKNMWCTLSVISATGRDIYEKDGEYIVSTEVQQGWKKLDLFEFVPVRLEVDNKGFTTVLDYNSATPNLKTIKLNDQVEYTEAMVGSLKYLFDNFQVE